ncbi:hypothetical protein N9K61_02495 [Flavobacteriaceae bacterium]|nr:hypothetical protein [Flavobacteriaceae bacterium]
MKKGLLTVLLASLVLVGCQNYDDQFDDLNAQISALKSQVDGLSSLSGQVSSLSGTISGLQSGISAATAAATAAGTAATAAGASADANATAIAAATAAANEAVAAGATNATAIAAATAAATAAGASADAATAAAEAAASAASLTALSASLTALAADVAEVQTAIASASTSAEVAALQAEIDAIEADLDDLLTSNNVYATNITINSAASMASALALGNKVNLMNGDVDITDDATIADADIQTFIDRLLTMGGAFRYDSGSATGYAPTFDKMVAATTIDVESAGDISFKALASATTVTLATTYTTKITSLDMSALASVTTFSSGADGSETANNITLASATNIDLGALTMYNVASDDDALTISMKKGGTLDIASLTGTERTTGLEEPLDLTVSGPASLSISKIADGTLAVSNVASLTVSGHYGTLDVGAGVETLTTTDTVTASLADAVDVVTATLDFKYDWDPSLTTAQAAVSDNLNNIGYLTDIAAAGDWVATDLKTLTVTGELLDLYLNESNLETLSIDATMHDLTITGTTDLTSLTIADGSKIGNILLTGANNLAVADFDHTSNLALKATGTTASTTVAKSVSFQVYDNTALTTVHSTGDDVSTLTVAGNDALTSVDFTGLKDQGTEASATVRVWDNDLTADSASNTSDGDTNRDAGLATDLGSYDVGTSGMKTLYAYLGNVDGDSDNTVFVTFDTLSSEVDTETSGSSTTSLNITGPTGYTNAAGDTTETPTATTKATILAMTPGSTTTAAVADKQAIAQRIGFYGSAATTALFNVASTTIPASAYTFTGNNAVDAANIASTANKDLATALGITLDAYNKGFSYSTVSLIDQPNSATTVNGERYTTDAALTAASTDTGSGVNTVWSTSMSGTFTLAVGDNSVTVSLGGAYGGSQATSTITDIEEALKSAWGLTYGATGTASESAIATLVGANDGKIEIQMLQTDSGGWGKAVTFSANAVSSSTDTRTSGNIDHVIGLTKSDADNSTIATASRSGLIITMTSNDAGTDLSKVSGVVDASSGSASLGAYATTFTSNTTFDASTYASTQVERTDVRSAEGFVAGSDAVTVAAVIFTRVAWLA